MPDKEIVTSPEHRGPYPGSRSKWWDEVKAGTKPRPHKFSPRIARWHRDTIAAVTLIESAAADS